jgi:hypothetical protein
MPDFEFTSPESKRFTVTGPGGLKWTRTSKYR